MKKINNVNYQTYIDLTRIISSHPTHMISMANIVAINVERMRIDNGCSLEKEFIELIHMNP